MTDSEDDVLSGNVYTFPNDRTTIHAKGPNYTNISTISCRNNFLTSTMHPPRNFERRNRNYDQRSLYYKRDTSPISLRSVPDFRPRNFHQPFSVGGAGYGRSCSPTSVRSIDTNVSMSATDIALAIKNEAYNKYDLKLIKEALNKQFKRKLRKRVEKRRNQRLLLHRSKRKSGDDSGEQGSDSSVSSDDCRSIRTAPIVPNKSTHKMKYNLTNLKMTNEDNMYNDCTEVIKRKSLNNTILSGAPLPKNSHQIKAKDVIHSNSEKEILLKDRFKNGFSLPLERFHKSLKESSHLSKLNDKQSVQSINTKQQINDNEVLKNNLNEDMDSEQEEVFSEITTIEKNCQITNNSHKRTMDLDDLHSNPQKKSKVSITQSHKSSYERNCLQNDVESDFIFAKPQMPVRKSCNTKKKLHSPEKLISKSRQPLFDIVENSHINLSHVKDLPIQTYPIRADNIEQMEKENGNKEFVKPAPLSDDLSMQPSFIKRKLFTQKLDVAEKKNISDSSLSNSPQIKNVNINKEKSKTRKLASSQSCLSRDVLEEDNNFLDLIHKIVPADQINITNATNKVACNRNSQRDSNDKWDITSVISTCLDKDISDTYTDEEIFKIDNNCNNKSKLNTNTKVQSKLTPNCKIVLQKLPLIQLTKTASNISHKQTTTNKTTKLPITECDKENTKVILKSFWDTDTESEMENYESSCNGNDSQINNKMDKSINKIKHCKKQQDQNAKCLSVEAKKAVGIRNKSRNGTNIKNAAGTGIKKTNKSDKRKISPESKENNNNLINVSCSSDRNPQKTNRLNEITKTVTLISHRMGRPKRQVRSKKVNTIESPSPKDSDNSIKEKEPKKPRQTSEVITLTSHRTERNKKQLKASQITPVESPSPKSTDNSASNLNISIKSLRSYSKKNKVNEKVVERNLKSRNRSGVKGI